MYDHSLLYGTFLLLFQLRKKCIHNYYSSGENVTLCLEVRQLSFALKSFSFRVVRYTMV